MVSIIAVAATGATLLWSSATYELQNKMIDIGWSKTNSEYIINECKLTAKDPRKCVVYASAIGVNETQACKTAFKNSCFGVQKAYDSEKESIRDWVKKWNKWWYKAKDASHFYGYKGKSPKTKYCMSEESSGSIGWCRNGYKNTSYFITKLEQDA